MVRSCLQLFLAGFLSGIFPVWASAQNVANPVKNPGLSPEGDIRELKLRDWEPRSMMATKTTILDKPLFPVVDIHNHLGGGKDRLTPATVNRYLTEMNEAGVKTVANMDGGWGDRLKETLAALDQAHPGRFLTFTLINFEGLDDTDWGEREAKRLEESFQAGAKGLKFHKSFGLSYRFKDGTRLAVDDAKLNPIWAMCASKTCRSPFSSLLRWAGRFKVMVAMRCSTL